MWKPEPSLIDLQYWIEQTGVSKERLLAAYGEMAFIRRFEETLAERYADGKQPEFNMGAGPIRGEMHLAAGQEAVAAGVCGLLEQGDVVVSTHRPHHHALAKGVDPKRMAAEIFGKAEGLCKGKGGHMHLFDVANGFACSGIVGASFPQAAGAALAFKHRAEPQVAVAFAGEGAANHGTFAEVLNVASLWQLPLIVVIEDNLYADSTPKWAAGATPQHYQRALAFNIPAYLVDGMDFIDVYRAAKRSIEHARAGYGPAVIEAVCYRFRGHFEGDGGEYRLPEEVEQWRGSCPIRRLGERLTRLGWADAAALQRLQDKAVAKVDAAMDFAQQSPLPEASTAFTEVFQ